MRTIGLFEDSKLMGSETLGRKKCVGFRPPGMKMKQETPFYIHRKAQRKGVRLKQNNNNNK